ncbi:MAG: nuclear transport factor 2 family protein [Acidimicrobiales bacterium]
MPEHPNIRLARQGYDAFARSDLAALLDLLADDVVWRVGGDGPLSGERRGRDEVARGFAHALELTGGTQCLDLLDVSVDDDGVVLVDETASRARDGATLDVRQAHVRRTDPDGKVVEFRDLPSDQAAHQERLS